MFDGSIAQENQERTNQQYFQWLKLRLLHQVFVIVRLDYKKTASSHGIASLGSKSPWFEYLCVTYII